jgi:hypothetical protein
MLKIKYKKTSKESPAEQRISKSNIVYNIEKGHCSILIFNKNRMTNKHLTFTVNNNVAY